MWRTTMDEADADVEWSDEDFMRTSAQTENAHNSASRRYLSWLNTPSTSQSISLATDPVSLILNRIDQELGTVYEHDSQVASARILPERSQFNPQRNPPFQEKITSFGKNGNGVHERKETQETPSDLDPFTAEEIDRKFKEIMLKKKVATESASQHETPTNSPSHRLRSWSSSRPSATMLSTGYGTDNDSVKTEDFESKFMGMLIQPTVNNTNVTEKNNRAERDMLDRLMTKTDKTTPEPDNKSKPIINNRPRSLSPQRVSGVKKSVVTFENQEELHTGDAQTQPFRVEIELQTDRRARSVSPTLASRNASSLPQSNSRVPARHNLSSRGSPYYKIKEDNEAAAMMQMSTDRSGQESNNFQQTIADKEMNTYTQALQLTRKKIIEAQEEARSAKEMAERAKSELLDLEFRRGNCLQDLERLGSDLARKKALISTVDAELHARGEELKAMKSLGVSKEDCLEVKAVREENLTIKSKLQNLDGVQLERDELVRQLDSAKEDLFREQKLARGKIDELQEEIDTLTGKLEEAEANWASLQDQNMQLEKSLRRTEREKNELIQEKTREYEELKTTFKEESSESQNRLKKEMKDLDQEIQKLRSKVNDLQVENACKDTHSEKLRCDINEIGSLLDQERQSKHQAALEQKKVLQHLRNETAAAMTKLKESMFLDKQSELEDVKRKMEEERLETVARNEEKLIQVLDEHSFQISEKDAEIANLEDALRRMDTYRQDVLEQQVLEAVAKERERTDFQKDWQLRQEKDEERQRSSKIFALIETEKQTNKELQTEIANLKKELDEQKKQQREAGMDKLVAVARTKDQMKEQNIAEIERIKFNLKQEHETEFERLNEKVQKQDLELTRLISEIDNAKEKERQALKALDHLERSVVTELNKECQRMSGATGVSPMMLHSVSLPSEPHDGWSSPSSKNRMAVTSALASLRSCHDNLLYHIAEMHHEQESLKMMVKAVTKEKDEAIDNCRLEMDRKRVIDLEKLKETLLKEHVSEMSNVIRECAETNTQLKTNSQILQRYGDAALLEALQAKDDELRTVQLSLNKWQEDTEDKFNTQPQLQVAKEREKYQALQHYSTREQKRISDLQKREIERLEKELQRFVKSGSHDSNRYVPSSPTPRQESAPAKAGLRSLPPPSPSSSLKSSQQLLQNRIEQLQAENAAMRKQRLLNSRQLSWSASNLTKTTPSGPISSLGRSISPTHDLERRHRLEERIRQSDEDTKTAEERTKMSNKIMNNKMEEMMKLQNTLYVQNQELQELERSYNDLQKQYHSRPCSPTRNLNTTM